MNGNDWDEWKTISEDKLEDKYDGLFTNTHLKKKEKIQ
jgi:hypothetical protein